MPRGGAIALGSLIARGAFRPQRTAGAHRHRAARARRLGRRPGGSASSSEYRLSGGGPRALRRGDRAHLRRAEPRTGRDAGPCSCCRPCPLRRVTGCARNSTWQGFGELGERRIRAPRGSGARSVELPASRRANLPPHLRCSRRGSPRPRAPARLVDLGWDLKRSRQALPAVRAALRARGTPRCASSPPIPQTGFILRTLLIHEYRRLHLRDPLLPKRLLPANWPGHQAARTVPRRCTRGCSRPPKRHLSSVAAQTRRRPAAAPSTHRSPGASAALG